VIAEIARLFPFDFFKVDMQEVKRQLFFRFKIRFLLITAGITGKAFKQEWINITRSLGNKNQFLDRPQIRIKPKQNTAITSRDSPPFEVLFNFTLLSKIVCVCKDKLERKIGNLSRIWDKSSGQRSGRSCNCT